VAEIRGLDAECTRAAASLDYEYVPEKLSSRSVGVDTERLESISTKLEEDTLPVADQMAEEIETVEVNNEELAEMNDSFRESVEIKQEFARQLDEYVEAYLMSVR